MTRTALELYALELESLARRCRVQARRFPPDDPEIVTLARDITAMQAGVAARLATAPADDGVLVRVQYADGARRRGGRHRGLVCVYHVGMPEAAPSSEGHLLFPRVGC